MDKLLEKVKKADFDFSSPWWKFVSAEAKIFIRKMMEINIDKRISAEQALLDPWILNNTMNISD